jgi:hypothetical protein
MKSQIAGFAIRALRHSDDWDIDRRKRFLLEPAIREPLSVDHNVWPDALVNFGVARDGVRFPMPVWSNLSVLRRAAGKTSGKEVVFQIYPQCPDEFLIFLEEIEPKSMDLNSWECLGFDVANAGLASALSNCGYSSETEMASAKAKFSSRLNDHGLFRTLEDAAEFVTFSEVRLPDDGPFHVYSLHTRALEDEEGPASFNQRSHLF